MARVEGITGPTAQPTPIDWGMNEPALASPSTISRIQTALWQTPVSRRDFLKGAFIVGAGVFATAEVTDTGLRLLEQEEIRRWKKYAVSNREFYEENRQALKNVRLATTFIPSYSRQDAGTSYGAWAKSHDQKILRTIVDSFGIKRVRLGLRFSDIVDKDGKVSLDFYQPTIDYLASQGVSMLLVFGPKNAGYPEVFLPEDYLARHHNAPEEGSIITLEDDIAKRSLEWANQACLRLGDYEKNITGVQPNNEPFARFGPEQQTIGTDFVVALGLLLANHFPQAKIIVNDNIWNLVARGKAVDTLAQLKAKGNNNGILGLDHYPFIPQLFDLYALPIAIRRFDPLLLTNLPGISLTDDINNALALGLAVQITEIQAMPYEDATGWDNKKPGDSAIGYRYTIGGALSLVPNINNSDLPEPVELSSYTARHLAQAAIDSSLTPDQKEMIELNDMLTQAA